MRANNGRAGRMGNHAVLDSVAVDGRKAELESLLRLAVARVARELMLVVPPSMRSESERNFLKDCVRDRRAASPETLAQLLAIGSRAPSPFHLSEAIRAIELQLAPQFLVDPLDASEGEQEIDALMDHAQIRAAREKCPAWWARVAELGPQYIHRLRVLTDAARYAAGKVRS